MSRKISSKVIGAFLNGSKLTIDNTWTNGKELFLWDNMIAYKNDKINVNDIIISMCGYNTSTTRDRLNELLIQLNKGHITSKNSTPYFIHEAIEIELDPNKEYSLINLIETEASTLVKIFGKEGIVKPLPDKKSKTEKLIGKKVKCWHCGSDQKILSIDHTFDCTSCNESLWTGEGGFEVVI